ncbi:MAG TPA: hypothetical protein VGN17_00830 [Bryobacteraceae bacterium]|jgi:hypothetical protein
MKHLLFLAFMLPAFGADPLPSADAVLNRYVQATGGSAAYEKVKSEIMTGKLEFPGLGLKGDLTRYSSGPDNYYMVAELAAIGKIESGVSHGIVWENSVVQGPRIKTGEERSQALVEAALVGSHDWRKLGFKVEMGGVEALDGEDCYKLILTRPEGKPMTVYFQKKSGLAVKTIAVAASQMGDIPFEAVMSDYKDFNGLLYPTRTSQTVVGQTIVYITENIQFNADIPASKFDLPDDIKALAEKQKK